MDQAGTHSGQTLVQSNLNLNLKLKLNLNLNLKDGNINADKSS